METHAASKLGVHSGLGRQKKGLSGRKYGKGWALGRQKKRGWVGEEGFGRLGRQKKKGVEWAEIRQGVVGALGRQKKRGWVVEKGC